MGESISQAHKGEYGFGLLLRLLTKARCDKFECRKFQVPYKKEKREFEVHFCPIWEWVRDMLSDLRLLSHMVWDARKLYQYDEITKSYVRFYDEPWTGKRFWEVQVGLILSSREKGRMFQIHQCF